MDKSYILTFLGILGDIEALYTYLMPFCGDSSLSFPRIIHLLSIMPTLPKVELLIFNIIIISLIVVPVVFNKYFKNPKSHTEN